MISFKRILHFSLSPSFDKKFLFNPLLNKVNCEVLYFSIGQSGYKHDKKSNVKLFLEYIKAIKFLTIGIGNLNKKTISYCHTSRYALPSIIICRLFGIGRVIYFNHGVPYVAYTGYKKVFLKFLEKLNKFFSHNYITVSPAMAVLLDELNIGKNRYKHSTYPGSSSGLPQEKFISFELLKHKLLKKRRKGIRYLYAGRFETRKGIFILLETWAFHIKKNPYDELWICGFEKNEIYQDVKYKNLLNLKILGYIENMTNIYDSVDIVVSPSFHEGFGYTLLEGASRGCCIICFSIPGPDVLFTKWMNSQLFDVGSIKSLLKIMSVLSNSEKKLKICKLLSWKSAKRFSIDKFSYPDIEH